MLRDARNALPKLALLWGGLASLPAAHAAFQSAGATRGWSASGEICVRLARFESESAFIVAGARTSAARIEVTRLGDTLALNGKTLEEPGSKKPARELWLEPENAAEGLALGEIHYPGRLRVRVLANSAASPAPGFAVDNIVDLEDYIAGVVAAEVQLIGAPSAELEAQAIASRSFALAQFAARGTRSLEVRLYDTTRDQAYAGKFMPTRDPRSQQAARSLEQAVESTRGKILSERGSCLDARFHAACGGRTANAADVFPEAAHFEALRGVDCEACLHPLGTNPANGASNVPVSLRDLSWRTTLGPAQLDRLARTFAIGEHTLRLEPMRSDRNGRWLEVELKGSSGSCRVSFENVRKELKDGAIASNLVLVTVPRAGEAIESGLMLTGRGRGHGVGLCQNGCHAYAQYGWSSAEILAHYYPGSALVDGR